MKSSRKQYVGTITLAWASCSLILLLIYMVAIVPQKQRKETLSKQLGVLRQIYESSVAEKQDQARSDLNRQLEAMRDKLLVFVADAENSADLIPDIGRLAGENKLQNLNIKKHKSTELPDCTRIKEDHITITFKAGYNQFAAFLNALERHNPIVYVDKFAIMRSTENDMNHEVKMELAVFVTGQQDY